MKSEDKALDGAPSQVINVPPEYDVLGGAGISLTGETVDATGEIEEQKNSGFPKC